jgi:WD40 repeat protein
MIQAASDDGEATSDDGETTSNDGDRALRQRFMEELKGMLPQCNQKNVEGALDKLCKVLQETFLRGLIDLGTIREARDIICESLTRQQKRYHLRNSHVSDPHHALFEDLKGLEKRWELHRVPPSLLALMEDFKEMLRQCNKGTVEGVIENVCELLHLVQQWDVHEFVCDQLVRQKNEEQRQGENDRNAFAVVLGSRTILDTVGKTTIGVPRGRDRERGRACTGLMVLGSDMLTIVSTFLAWEKVELQREWEVGGSVVMCLFSPCGEFILTVGKDDELKLWVATSGELVRVFESSMRAPGAFSNISNSCVLGCCFTPDGKTVVGADYNAMLRLWDVESGNLSRTLEGHAGPVYCVDVSPDGAHILSVSKDRTARLWNFITDVDIARSGTLKCTVAATLSSESWNECNCCSFSPDGALFLIGDGPSLKLHDSKTHQLQHTLTPARCHGVMSCSFAPDGASILSGYYNGRTLKLWCTATGGLLRTLYGHTSGGMVSCAFSPNGLTIVSGKSYAYGGPLRLWTAATGQLQQTIDADSGEVHSCCFFPDGKSVLSVYQGGLVKVWGLHPGSLRTSKHASDPYRIQDEKVISEPPPPISEVQAQNCFVRSFVPSFLPSIPSFPPPFTSLHFLHFLH